MVFNWLYDPDLKLGVFRWLESVTMVRLLRPLVDQELSLVFYGMIITRAEGASVQADDLRQYKYDQARFDRRSGDAGWGLRAWAGQVSIVP